MSAQRYLISAGVCKRKTMSRIGRRIRTMSTALCSIWRKRIKKSCTRSHSNRFRIFGWKSSSFLRISINCRCPIRKLWRNSRLRALKSQELFANRSLCTTFKLINTFFRFDSVITESINQINTPDRIYQSNPSSLLRFSLPFKYPYSTHAQQNNLSCFKIFLFHVFLFSHHPIIF